MKRYIFCIKTKQDLKKVVIATLKRVYSDTVVPRVLTNCYIDDFIKLSNGTIFLCQIHLDLNKFKNYVHNKNYDLGLFFCKINKKNVVIVIDGTGNFACTHTLNIFLDIFLKNSDEIKIIKKSLKNQYKTKKNSTKMADFRY